MAGIIPFKRSGRLINEIDGFLDSCDEAALLLETTLLHYFAEGADEQLEARVEQVRAVETRADELRRSVIGTMFTEMLMPDTRGDVLDLLDAVDGGLDGSVHLLVKLAIERPEVPDALGSDSESLAREVSAALRAVLAAARTYFSDPLAVRGSVNEVSFHSNEATSIGLRLGRALYDSELPLERKIQLGNFLSETRALASSADDIADQLVIYAVKRLD